MQQTYMYTSRGPTDTYRRTEKISYRTMKQLTSLYNPVFELQICSSPKAGVHIPAPILLHRDQHHHQ